MIKPYRKDSYLVKVISVGGKVGSIIMPKFKYNAEHNAQKMFRTQTWEIIDTNGIEYEGIKAGDKVITTRWAAVPIQGTPYHYLPKNRIHCILEEHK